MAVKSAFSTELLKFAGNVASTAHVDADIGEIQRTTANIVDNNNKINNNKHNASKGIRKGLLNLLGDVAATVNIDTHIDIRRVKCSCTSPNGYPTRVTATDNHDGTFTLEINVTQAGIYTLDVKEDGDPINGSPFRIKVHQTGETEKVRLTGVGLHSGLISDVVGVFQIDTRGAGPGKLEVHIDGPKGGFQVEMTPVPNEDRIVCVDYNPSLEGVYNINVFWDGYHVPGSPRLVFIAPDENLLETWMQNPTLMLAEKKEAIETEGKNGIKFNEEMTFMLKDSMERSENQEKERNDIDLNNNSVLEGDIELNGDLTLMTEKKDQCIELIGES